MPYFSTPQDLKECSFAPKLVSRNHLQLQVNKAEVTGCVTVMQKHESLQRKSARSQARRHLQNLAEQQQAVLLRLDVLQDGDGKAGSTTRTALGPKGCDPGCPNDVAGLRGITPAVAFSLYEADAGLKA